MTKPKLYQEGPVSRVPSQTNPGFLPSSLLPMAFQESTVPDVYQANFEPTAYLDYFKLGQNPLSDEFLHFLLKHYNATFKSGAGLLQPWGRLGGHANLKSDAGVFQL